MRSLRHFFGLSLGEDGWNVVDKGRINLSFKNIERYFFYFFATIRDNLSLGGGLWQEAAGVMVVGPSS